MPTPINFSNSWPGSLNQKLYMKNHETQSLGN
jgi:hypothetical protein